MSEEESFVILGSASAPNSSVQNFVVIDDLNPSQSEQSDQQQHTNMMPSDPNLNLPSNGNGVQQSSPDSESESNSKETSINSNENNKLKFPLQNSNNSFAASFIIGDLEHDIGFGQHDFKESDSSEFSSLREDRLDSDDDAKLKKLIEDSNLFKENLMSSNIIMMRCIVTIENLKTELENHKETHQKDIKDCRVLIEDLQAENRMMKMKFGLESGKPIEENHEELEENSEIVENVNELIKNVNETTVPNNTKESIGLIPVEAVISISEHDKLMSAKDNTISEMSDQNLKLKNEIQQMFDEMMALRHQVDVYYTDFQEERKLKIKASNDRNQILKDVANLQKRLEQCVGVAAQNKSNLFISGEGTKSGKGESFKTIKSEEKGKMKVSNEDVQFVCPICEKEYEDLNELHVHVQQCIDKNE